MSDLSDEFSDHVDAVVEEFGSLSSRSSSKFRGLEDWLGQSVGLRDESVTAKYIGDSRNLGNRIGEMPRRNSEARLGCVLVPDDLLAALEPLARRFLEEQQAAFEAVVIATNTSGRWKPTRIFALEGSQLVDQLKAAFAVASIESVTATDSQRPAGDAISLVPAPDLVIDPRIRRMVRLAIASSPGVLLVGPPGTGKTTLLKEVIAELQAAPEKFGFSRSPKPPKWTTPEESWTTRELVGGETIDDKARLRFRPGHLLEAIRNDQWLVLDEANRADMDKIFGGLMTWLAGQRVELGRASTAIGAPSVILDWGSSPECETLGIEELEAEVHEESEVSFLAGKDWRLLGTYNALDAQRVFRFGQALGRRFIRVPIPAMSTDDFARAIAPRLAGLPDLVKESLVSLYAAHAASPTTALGPAIFMRAEAYIRRGLELPEIGTLEGGTQALDEGLVAEAYLTAAGTWLAKLEAEDLEALGARIRDRVFSTAEWEWIVNLLPALA